MACESNAVAVAKITVDGILVETVVRYPPQNGITHTTRAVTPTGGSTVYAGGTTAYGQAWGAREIHTAWYPTGTQFGFLYSYYGGMNYWQLNYLTPGSGTWSGLNPSGNGSAYIAGVYYVGGTNPAATYYLDLKFGSTAYKTYGSTVSYPTVVYECFCDGSECAKGVYPNICCVNCGKIKSDLQAILSVLKTKM
jgi:hypothetical protein